MLIQSVFSHKNYREYLQAFYSAKKKESEAYSYRRFSEDAGITAPNFLKLVIDGKKNLTTNTIVKFAKALGFHEQETLYFEALVLENQAADEEERKYYAKKLKSLFEKPQQRTVKLSKKLKLFEHPKLPALITFIAGQPVRGASKLLATTLNLTETEVSTWIEMLKEKGLLHIEDEVYGIDFDHAFFIEHPSDLQLKMYLRDQLRNSNRAFEKSYDKGAKFYTHTMGIDPVKIADVVEELKAFLSHLNSKYQTEPASDLLQINSQIFLLSRALA